jgi:hypothetical protein
MVDDFQGSMYKKNYGITISQGRLCLLIKAVASKSRGHDGFPVIYVMRSIPL